MRVVREAGVVREELIGEEAAHLLTVELARSRLYLVFRDWDRVKYV